MDFRKLTAVFTVYSNAFKVMHWGAIGNKFDRIHKLCEEYYDMVGTDLDALAEMGIRLGQKPATLAESIDILHGLEGHEFIIIQSFEDINYERFVKLANVMLNDILWCIATELQTDDMKNIVNVGIKSSLEAMYEKYDLQARYLNARRFDK